MEIMDLVLTKKLEINHIKKWSEWRDLNPRPPGPKPDTLPSCATLRKSV